MNDKLLVEKAYVEISSYRLKTLKSIGTNVKIPKQIAKDCGIKQNHISKTLKELKTHGLIECINEEVRKGRLYRLTPFGLSVLEEVQWGMFMGQMTVI